MSPPAAPTSRGLALSPLRGEDTSRPAGRQGRAERRQRLPKPADGRARCRPDAGRRTPDAGRRTPDAGRRHVVAHAARVLRARHAQLERVPPHRQRPAAPHEHVVGAGSGAGSVHCRAAAPVRPSADTPRRKWRGSGGSHLPRFPRRRAPTSAAAEGPGSQGRRGREEPSPGVPPEARPPDPRLGSGGPVSQGRRGRGSEAQVPPEGTRGARATFHRPCARGDPGGGGVCRDVRGYAGRGPLRPRCPGLGRFHLMQAQGAYFEVGPHGRSRRTLPCDRSRRPDFKVTSLKDRSSPCF